MGLFDFFLKKGKKKKEKKSPSYAKEQDSIELNKEDTQKLNISIEDESQYDSRGFDKHGFDKDGYNVFGFTKDHFDKNHRDYKGYDEEGYDLDGYKEDGFNKFDMNRYGHYRNEYDEDGYLLVNGRNDQGFDRFGRDLDGYDEEGLKDGYDREGFTKEGYDKDGFNRNNLTIDGYDRLGYKNGYNRKGFDSFGMDREGYFEDSYNLAGFDRKGRDRQGYDIFGFDEFGHTREYNLFFINDQQKINNLTTGDIIYSSVYGPMEILAVQKIEKTSYFTLISERLNAKPIRSLDSIHVYLSQNPPKKIETEKYGTLALFQMDKKEFALGKNFLQEVRRYKNNQFGEHLYLNLPRDWMQAEASFSMEQFQEESAYLKDVNRYIKSKFLRQLKSKIENQYNAQYLYENPMRMPNVYSKSTYMYTAEDVYSKESEKVLRKPYIGSITLDGQKLYIS